MRKSKLISSLIPSSLLIFSPIFLSSCSNTNKALVIYFSCTNNTKDVADKIVNYLHCDSFQIQPTIPYNPATDFGPEGRANIEQANPTARPAISNNITNFGAYSHFFIGYPIWAGTLPKIIYTLCDAYDFNHKTIIPFCTSTETPITTSENELKMLEKQANFINSKGFIYSSLPSQNDVDNWIKSLNLSLKYYLKFN